MMRVSVIAFLLTGALLVSSALVPAVQAQEKRVPAGGDAALACGQKPDGRAYWTEYAFCDLPVRGPQQAKGLVFWSHGVSGKNVQYTAPAPPFIRRFAQAGWDVVKINRNNLYETCWTGAGNISNCWSGGGSRHADDLIERAKAAHTQGYQRVIAGGQSFGGAISIEANARVTDLFYAVVAASPGHGSDASDGSSTRGAYYTLDKQLLDVLATQRSGRVVVSLPPFDAYSPNRDSDPIWPKARTVLQGTSRPFVLLGENLPINGHLAATTLQFSTWFGDCLRDFVDPARTIASGEITCRPPEALPAFLLPADLKIPVPGTTGVTRWLGAWEGAYAQEGRQLLIVVESIDGATATVLYSSGSGPKREFGMGWDRYRKARITDDKLTIDRGNGRILTLTLAANGTQVDVSHVSATSTFTGTLQRREGKP